MYHDCGQFYCFRVGRFLACRQLVTAHTRAILVPEMEVQDIDSEQDWRLAELKYQLMREKTDALGMPLGGKQMAGEDKGEENAKIEEKHSKKERAESKNTLKRDSKAGRHCFLRKAGWEDMDQLFLWANDKEVRENSFSTAPISYEEHRKWYGRKMQEEGTQIYILCDGALEVGALRLEFGKDGAGISYSIACGYRGNGYGQELVALAEQEVRQWAEHKGDGKAVIRAQVKPENLASNKIFKNAGYQEHEIGYQKVIWPKP